MCRLIIKSCLCILFSLGNEIVITLVEIDELVTSGTCCELIFILFRRVVDSL